MLLAITSETLDSHLSGKKGKAITLEEAPRFAAERLGVHGMVLDSKYLAGWSLERLDTLRNCADQAQCPCLILRESRGVVTTGDAASQAAAMQRVELVTRAAQRLGCSAVSFRVDGVKGSEQLEHAAKFLRRTMERVERIDVNLLLEHGSGDLEKPEALVEMVKRVGGFRVGTMPNFGREKSGKDSAAVLRQTAPYAAAVLATIPDSEQKDAESEIESALARVRPCMEALNLVGLHQVLALDYLGEGEMERVCEAVKREVELLDEDA